MSDVEMKINVMWSNKEQRYVSAEGKTAVPVKLWDAYNQAHAAHKAACFALSDAHDHLEAALAEQID